MRLALIGFGNIGAALLPQLKQHAGGSLSHLTVLVRSARIDATKVQLARDWPGLAVSVVESVGQLLAERPALVVECAGQQAVQLHAAAVLEAGVDLVLVSIGALADSVLHERLRAAAIAGRARLILPAGAVGGIDLLAALRRAGALDVAYRGIKPPAAWAGTPAEQLLKLTDIAGPTTFFRGSARQAARDYPKNANVAATLALAGAGFEATTVELVADPTAAGNIHEYRVISPLTNYTIRIENQASGNVKTSATTIFSVLREIINRIDPVDI